MNTTIIIIGFIAIAVSVIWGTKFKTNVGIAALVFAFLLGLFGLGMKASDIYAFWPARTTVQLIIVTAFFGFAVENGTIDYIAKLVIYWTRKIPWALPIVYLLLNFALSAIGVSPPAVNMFLIPIFITLCYAAKTNELFLSIGSNAGGIWDTSMRESGREFTETYVAVPGHSEHETGLAIDLGLKQDVIDFIRPEFPYEGICQRFRQLAPKYGFIERYPKGKEEVTGIGQEPWHFRYVGVPHAEIMTEKGMVLEEYMEFLRGYEYGKNPYRYCSQGKEIWISYLNAGQSEQICLDADRKTPRVISGNNVDGFVITEWSTCRG